jgi:glycogen(starch) synthase
MNIILYSRPYWPSVGGVEATSRILARTLVELGHNVSVFTSTSLLGKTELTEGYTISRSSSLLAFVRIARTADLVLIKGGVSAFAGCGGVLARVPMMVIWHEMAERYELPGKTCKVLATNFVKRRIVERSSGHVGVTCACLESRHLADEPERCIRKVIYNPISSELETAAAVLDVENRNTDILFVGRLIAGKGIFVLSEALRILDRQGCPLRAKIVGDGCDRGLMEATLRNLQAMTVTFEGSQEDAGLAQSYASARVLVVPSTAPEGMGLVVAEGMAFGLPVIVSDQAALKEVVGDAGVIVRIGDAEALAYAIHALLQDDERWRLLSDRARKRSELFSMPKFRQGIIDLLGEVTKLD